MWLIFSFLSALTQATHQAISKRFAKDLSPYLLGSGVFFAASPILLYYALSGHWPNLNNDFYFSTTITAVLNAIATILFLKAVTNVDLSLATPILALTPVFSLFSSYIILGESPRFLGAAGVLIVTLGLIILSHRHNQKNDFAIEAETKKEKWGLAFLILVSLIYSVSSNYDKVVAQNSPFPFGSAYVSSLIGLIIFCVGFIKGDCRILQNKKKFFKSFLLGALFIIASLVWFKALLGGLVVYSLAIKRTSVLIGVIYGYIWFKEKKIGQRFAGALVILIGLIFIIFFK
ncbi:MAG: DMT family transporter [Patescibacteria group bacterium]